MRIRILILPVMMVGLAIMLTGCSWFAKAPMDVLYYSADEGTPQRNLFIFMRGIGGSHTSFEEEGLVDDVRTMGLPFDMAAPNAHLGYYTGRTLLVRLKTDVIDPARAQGKDNIWLVGFSMGGLGSMLYLREHPDDIEGICLVAPFLGDEDIIEEIQAAGGVRSWSPGVYDADDDYQRMLWHWIKDNVAGNSPVPIFLGYGTDDDFAPANALLAELLPENHVVRIPGGHDYPTFKALWDLFLDSGIYRP
jgi:pimeloyl-ACP methyl ester carboxylesterase